MKENLFLIVGDKGAGKTTLVNKLFETNVSLFADNSQINSYFKKITADKIIVLYDVYGASPGSFTHPLYGWDKNIIGLIVVLDARAEWKNIKITIARYGFYYPFQPVQFVITHAQKNKKNVTKITNQITLIWGENKLPILFEDVNKDFFSLAENDFSYKQINLLALARFVNKTKTLVPNKEIPHSVNYHLKTNNISDPDDRQFVNAIAQYMKQRVKEWFAFSFNQTTVEKRSQFLQQLINLIHANDLKKQIEHLKENNIRTFKGVFSQRLYDLLTKRRLFLLDKISSQVQPDTSQVKKLLP